ncbi:hypothetical protein [Lysinibacillus sp. NPDC086135]|uniref:hypothetical protein n=1 Tax=Lysinibacillus sp. NPDC086135 TaxID=3364130 RepID=UPI00382D0CAF
MDKFINEKIIEIDFELSKLDEEMNKNIHELYEALPVIYDIDCNINRIKKVMESFEIGTLGYKENLKLIIKLEKEKLQHMSDYANKLKYIN